jgi:hypothetical protein
VEVASSALLVSDAALACGWLCLEVDVTEARDDEHHEEPEIAGDGADDERINDPLTQTEVEAPRVPFGSQASGS